jgi:putative ABC transport system ATP-binding protein
MSSIRCRQLCKTFKQGDEIITGLDHIDLDIDEGEFVCLSGPSGSGKTTLLNAIGGLDTPDSGEIHMGNIRVDQLERGPLADMRLRHIGFVFQAYNLIPVLTAQENVEFVMEVQGLAAAERAQKARAILEEVGLEGMEDRRPAQLSGGQQREPRQRIGRAPDGPVSGIEPASQDYLRHLYTRQARHALRKAPDQDAGWENYRR